MIKRAIKKKLRTIDPKTLIYKYFCQHDNTEHMKCKMNKSLSFVMSQLYIYDLVNVSSYILFIS